MRLLIYLFAHMPIQVEMKVAILIPSPMYDFTEIVFIEDYIEAHGLKRLEWPAGYPILNPVEHFSTILAIRNLL